MADNNTDATFSLGSAYKKLIGSDWLKAAITAFFTAFFGSLLILLTPLLSKQDLPTWLEVRFVIMASLASGLGALSRKYFTNSVGQPFKKEPEKVVAVTEIK